MLQLKCPIPAIVAILGLSGGEVASAQDGLLQLGIGAAPRRDSNLTVELDELLDTSSGTAIAPAELSTAIDDRRIVLIGEEHTDASFHAIQLHVLELLNKAAIPLIIGLEMFPASSQTVLDRWVRDGLAETEFLEDSDWYRVWGYNWDYYRRIFEFAREHQIRLIGLNEDRLGARPTSRAQPSVTADVTSDDHRALVRAFFEVDSPVHGGLTDEQFEQLFRAQARRDAVMAAHAAAALDRNPLHTLVVLAGTGHVLYDLGIARQLPRPYREAAASIVPVPIDDDRRTVSASVASFVWGIPSTKYPAYPELGVVAVQTDGGLDVIHVDDDSPAAAAGIRLGDRLVRFGDDTLSQRSDLSRAIAAYAWGDVVAVALQRDESTIVVNVALRR